MSRDRSSGRLLGERLESLPPFREYREMGAIPGKRETTGVSPGRAFDAPLTTVEAAKVIGVSWKTLSKWRLNRRGPPFFKAGGRVTYRLKDIERWMTSRKFDPENDDGPQAA